MVVIFRCHLKSSTLERRFQAIYRFSTEISVGSVVIKTKDKSTRSVHFSPVVALIGYTQKSTRSTLALKLSVAPPVYLWVTATAISYGSSMIAFSHLVVLLVIHSDLVRTLAMGL